MDQDGQSGGNQVSPFHRLGLSPDEAQLASAWGSCDAPADDWSAARRPGRA